MRYSKVCLDSINYTLPKEIVTSDDLEQRLEPLYSRLKLPAGRLELMTGIAARRVWEPGTLPSDKSIESGRAAIQTSGIDPREIGALVHASVCRDHLEPATACRVHHELGLPAECQIFDLSNACLGLLNGVLLVANMIELGQIRAGLVVGTEDSRPLMETTIRTLNEDTTLTRNSIKLAVASLTIGSGSAAIMVTDRELSPTGNRLMAAVAHANTAHHRLCHSGRDEAAGDGMAPLMQTDSEQLMEQGISTGRETFERFLVAVDCDREDFHKTICHQVGATHRKLMIESLGLNIERDYATFPWLGNTGSVALPITMARAIEAEHIEPGDHVGMLGIGSGINCVMLAVDWQRSLQAAPTSDELAAAIVADDTN